MRVPQLKKVELWKIKVTKTVNRHFFSRTQCLSLLRKKAFHSKSLWYSKVFSMLVGQSAGAKDVNFWSN
jgi:hypothetical protein